MAVESTTSDPVLPADENPELKAEEITTEAVDENEDTSQTSESEESGSEESEEDSQETDNSEDTELKDWAAKKNLPLDDPLKIAKMYRESEKALGKKGQKEGQLKSAVTTANASADVDDIQAIRNEMTALSFKVDHPDAVPLEGVMTEILEERPWMASDLEGVLDMAKGRSLTDAASLLAARQAGKKEAREADETKGRAAPPRTSATNSATTGSSKITPANVDEILGKHMGDADWYKVHLPEINAALAG